MKNQNARKKLAIVAALSGLSVVGSVAVGGLPASAHGAAKAPISRSLGCKTKDNPEFPATYEGCKLFCRRR